jgi:hypothetical protein
MVTDQLDTSEGFMIMIAACAIGVPLILLGLFLAWHELRRHYSIVGLLCITLGAGLIWYDRPTKPAESPQVQNGTLVYEPSMAFTAKRSLLSGAGGLLICFGAYYFSGIFRSGIKRR